ncbi:hypothetical protein AD006_25550 [Pseudonocardia sp. EC080610-09]|nr:hypothetical protein AD006_25550 [Pseudonocardia sp. EC080610-09]ALL80747.1 hypothetical protein AD017_05140 [Pseudonocardia sp. EC080619-01]
MRGLPAASDDRNWIGSGTEIVSGCRPRSRGGRSVCTPAAPGSPALAGAGTTRCTPGSAVGLPATQTTACGPSARTDPIAENGVSSSEICPFSSRTASASNPCDDRANTTRPSSRRV